jgi:hypothetical protein
VVVADGSPPGEAPFPSPVRWSAVRHGGRIPRPCRGIQAGQAGAPGRYGKSVCYYCCIEVRCPGIRGCRETDGRREP